MPVKAQFIIDTARDILRDVRLSAQRYTDLNYLAAINLGQRAMVHLNPDTNVVVEKWQLQAGALQTLPDDCKDFRRLVRNRGVSGQLMGAVIVPVSQEAMDRADADWYNDTPSVDVVHSIKPDGKNEFYVWPPQPATTSYVDAEFVKIPEDIASANDNISVRDEFASALPYWCASYLLSQDNEDASSMSRAEKYSALFLAQLGITPEDSDG